MKACAGFQLIELIAAMCLSGLLTLTCHRLLFTVQSTSDVVQATADQLDKVRFLDRYLRKQIHSARSTQSDPNEEDAEGVVSRPEPFQIFHYPNHPDWLDTPTDPSSDLVRIGSTVYFIARTNRRDRLRQPIYAFYEKTKDMPRLELVDHIRQLQLKRVQGKGKQQLVTSTFTLTTPYRQPHCKPDSRHECRVQTQWRIDEVLP